MHAKAKPAPRARRGGRNKRFDTVWEKFWGRADLKAAIIRFGREQPGSLDYSGTMRFIVESFIREHRIPVPTVAEAGELLRSISEHDQTDHA